MSSLHREVQIVPINIVIGGASKIGILRDHSLDYLHELALSHPPGANTVMNLYLYRLFFSGMLITYVPSYQET